MGEQKLSVFKAAVRQTFLKTWVKQWEAWEQVGSIWWQLCVKETVAPPVYIELAPFILQLFVTWPFFWSLLPNTFIMGFVPERQIMV